MSRETPMWVAIDEDLRTRLARGEFDERFPTDRELVDEYQVSRHTVREAVRGLQDEGLITRNRGRGSFRTQESFAQPLGTIYSLFRSIEDNGVTQASVVISQEERTDETASQALGLTPDASLFYLERTRLAGGQPLAVDRVWLPMPLAAPLLEANFTRGALYEELRDRCGVVPEEGVEESRPVNVDRETAVRLGLAPGAPAFEIDRRTKAGGRPLEWRISIVRGDRYVFKAEWNTPWEATTSRLVETDES
ncbi:MAG: GntR family transcriptional regulator [Acidimicrobiia bacterium]